MATRRAVTDYPIIAASRATAARADTRKTDQTTENLKATSPDSDQTARSTTGYRLAASAEMIYLDLPFIDRVRRIHDRGLLVEIWGWSDKDIEALAASPASIVSMTGYLSGNLTEDDGIATFLATAERSIEVAKMLNCPSLNVHGTGLGEGGLPVRPVDVVTPAMWLRAADTLRLLADLGAKHDKVFTLENLNLPVDHPGTPFALASDTRTLVSAVNSPNLRMNLDLYHAQIGEGNLIELVKASQPWIGEIQVADVPGRCEPGTGELNYAAVARVLRDIGYTGVVAMEAFAKGDSDAALDAFTAAFA